MTLLFAISPSLELSFLTVVPRNNVKVITWKKKRRIMCLKNTKYKILN